MRSTNYTSLKVIADQMSGRRLLHVAPLRVCNTQQNLIVPALHGATVMQRRGSQAKNCVGLACNTRGNVAAISLKQLCSRRNTPGIQAPCGENVIDMREYAKP